MLSVLWTVARKALFGVGPSAAAAAAPAVTVDARAREMATNFLRAARTLLARTPLLPITTAATAPTLSSRVASKFGGKRPFLLAGEPWPVCRSCEEPLRFFAQINIAQLPADAPQRKSFGDDGLMQLFVCTGDCDTYAAGSDSVVVRVLPAHQLVGADERADASYATAEVETLDEKIVIDWKRGEEELPNVEELLTYADEIGVQMTPEVEAALFDADIADGPSGGVKVGGWPNWVQGIEYPTCPTCEGTMTNVVLQLEESDEVDFMWGDAGIAHVTQCPKHPDHVAFAWACC